MRGGEGRGLLYAGWRFVAGGGVAKKRFSVFFQVEGGSCAHIIVRFIVTVKSEYQTEGRR